MDGFLLRFRDERSGKVVVVAHCILNQNSRISGSAHRPAIADEVVNVLNSHRVGFLQMPCPELTFEGAGRSPKTRQEYDTPSYRRHCQQIASSIVSMLKEFVRGGVEVIALLGIKNSPSCDVGRSKDETGILMEEFLALTKRGDIQLTTRAIDVSGMAPDVEWLERLLGES